MTERRSGEGLVMVVAMLLPSLVTLLYFVVLAGTVEWLQQAAYAVGKTVQFGLPVIWVGLVCRQRLGWPTPTARGLAGGVGFGLLVLVLTLLLYQHVLAPRGVLDAAVANIREKVLELGISTVWQYVALGVFYSIVHSLLEEYYWRWFVFGRLRRVLQPWSAMWISSGAFMAHHVFILATFFGWMTPWTYLFSLAVAVGGLFWAWLYQRSGSLYGPWLSHMLIDAAIFLIGYDLVGGMFAAA